MSKILVVDDCKTVRMTISRFLTRAGYEAVTAENGLQAIDLFQEVQPDLTILDINMPGLDGYEVCERLQGLNPALPPLVVFLTSEKNKALEMLGEEFGAYLHKPCNESRLLATVEDRLSLSLK